MRYYSGQIPQVGDVVENYAWAGVADVTEIERNDFVKVRCRSGRVCSAHASHWRLICPANLFPDSCKVSGVGVFHEAAGSVPPASVVLDSRARDDGEEETEELENQTMTCTVGEAVDTISSVVARLQVQHDEECNTLREQVRVASEFQQKKGDRYVDICRMALTRIIQESIRVGVTEESEPFVSSSPLEQAATMCATRLSSQVVILRSRVAELEGKLERIGAECVSQTKGNL